MTAKERHAAKIGAFESLKGRKLDTRYRADADFLKELPEGPCRRCGRESGEEDYCSDCVLQIAHDTEVQKAITPELRAQWEANSHIQDAAEVAHTSNRNWRDKFGI
jgi:hypothetical protein